MTIPVERTRAVIHTRQFLYDLLDPKKTPRVSKSIRASALHCLRHYPTDFDMEIIAEREDNDPYNIMYKIFGKGC
jgi:hypothetical protein